MRPLGKPEVMLFATTSEKLARTESRGQLNYIQRFPRRKEGGGEGKVKWKSGLHRARIIHRVIPTG